MSCITVDVCIQFQIAVYNYGIFFFISAGVSSTKSLFNREGI